MTKWVKCSERLPDEKNKRYFVFIPAYKRIPDWIGSSIIDNYGRWQAESKHRKVYAWIAIPDLPEAPKDE